MIGAELWVPGATATQCPPGFSVSTAGCVKRRTALGASTSLAENPGTWLGIGGLLLSVGLMIAMGFHKPPHQTSRRRYR